MAGGRQGRLQVSDETSPVGINRTGKQYGHEGRLRMFEQLKDQRIALIGGAGFIGHNLALALVEQGAHVEVVDGLMVNNLGALASTEMEPFQRELYLKMIHQRLDLLHQAGVQVHAMDARDYHGLSRVIDVIGPQVIVQLAAVAHAGRSNKDPFSTFDHSLRTLENALDRARERVEQFVYFSSSMVYGHFQGRAVTEETPLDPIGIYGALKLSGEKLVIAYNQVFDLPYTIIRPSALYGERCVSRRVGQIFIEKAMRGEALRVNGSGQEKLDFTYIGDLIQGVLLVLANPKAINQTFNLTYGSSRSIMDLISILENHFPKLKVEHQDRDKLIPIRGTLSVSKAQELLGYQPKYPIEEGYERYVNWYKDFWPGVC